MTNSLFPSVVTCVDKFIVQITDPFEHTYTLSRNAAPSHVYEGMKVDIFWDEYEKTMYIEDWEYA